MTSEEYGLDFVFGFLFLQGSMFLLSFGLLIIFLYLIDFPSLVVIMFPLFHQSLSVPQYFFSQLSVPVFTCSLFNLSQLQPLLSSNLASSVFTPSVDPYWFSCHICFFFNFLVLSSTSPSICKVCFCFDRVCSCLK